MAEQATLTGKRYELTVETMQACQLDFVSRGNFLRFLKTHGDACLQAAQHVSRDYHEACDVARSVGLSRGFWTRTFFPGWRTATIRPSMNAPARRPSSPTACVARWQTQSFATRRSAGKATLVARWPVSRFRFHVTRRIGEGWGERET